MAIWKRVFPLLAITVYLYFLAVALRSVFWGGIPFWSDPARDLLLALANHQKLTLIGQPGGIPGVFYLPYWIWIISLIQVFTKDPQFIAFFVATVPYFFVGLVLAKHFSRIFGPVATLALAIFFLLTYGSYDTFIWNPYPAPLVFIFLAYMVYRWDVKSLFFAGVALALLASFHLSFFTGITLACGLLFFFSLIAGIIKHRHTFQTFLRSYLAIVSHFLAGVLLIFLPFSFFEIRHGFHITTFYLLAIVNSALYNSAVVGQVGLSKSEVLEDFLKVPTTIFHLPVNILSICFIGLILACLMLRRFRFSIPEWRLIAFLTMSLGSLIYLYASSKNPVWDYYFIGTEVIVLLLVGIIVSRIKPLALVLLGWALFLLIQNAIALIREPIPKFYLVPSLTAKETVVNTIYTDSQDQKFTVAAYTPSIYSYDYDYLFQWLGNKYNNKPVAQSATPNFVYLIIPPDTSQPVRDDFMHYKTPDNNFSTVWEKVMPDGTEIIKRAPLPIAG